MGIKIYSGYVSMTPQQTFRRYFIFAAIFNVFGLMSCFLTHIHDSELTKHKWLGGLVGTVASTVMLGLVYVFCNVADITALGVILFASYYLALILWGVISRKKRKSQPMSQSDLEKLWLQTYGKLPDDDSKS